MEGDAVDGADEQQRPVRAAFCGRHVAVVVDGEEDVGRGCEGGEGFAQGEGVGRVEQHEGHAGPEEDDAGFGVGGEVFALEVFFPEGYGLGGGGGLVWVWV